MQAAIRLITIIFAIASCSPLAFAADADRPNVLFIAVDDLKPILGCYGDTTAITPNIDRLASRGTVFLNAQCQWPVCGPTRASLMTSLRPEATGVMDLKTSMRAKNPDVLTLPQHFRNNGYATAGAGKIYDPRCVDDKHTLDEPSWSVPYAKLPYHKTKFNGEKRFALAPDVADHELVDGQITISGVNLMRQLSKSDQPFFLAVGFKKPHLPFIAPKKYWELYKRDQLQLPAHRGGIENASGYSVHSSPEFRGYEGVPEKGELSEELQREAMHGYFACTSYVDAQIGILLDELDQLGLRDDTAIVLWGDHGFHLGDHGMWGKHSTLEQAARVPLIICPPGSTTTRKTTSPVEFTDIFPTLCEFSGLSLPDHIAGRSLAPMTNGTKQQVRNGALTVFKSKGCTGYSYRTERYRYTEWINNKFNMIAAAELYDYDTDPLETKNLVEDPKYASVRSQLAKQMRAEGDGCDRLLATQPKQVSVNADTPSVDSLPAAKPTHQPPPNIVFIIADDMHRHMFNCLPEGKGRNLTPNIDRLAQEGTLMLGQHVSAPVCTPSRYSCLTGLYASRTKCKSFQRELQRTGQAVVQWNCFITDEDTLPRRLKRSGYATGFVGKNHVFEGEVEKVGYHEDPRDPQVVGRLRKRQQQAEGIIQGGGFDYVASLYYENPDHNGPRKLAVHNLDWTTDGALRFIDQNRDQPFFLYYATTTPHGPGEASRSWNADPRAIPTGFLEKPLDVLPARSTIPDRIRSAGLQPNASRCNLLWLDDSVGAIMDRLRAHGLDENTIVVFFNDHGQAAKGTLYQGGITNPSIIWRKGGFACGSVNHSAVSNIDFAPTLLDLVGVEFDKQSFDGQSFAAQLNGQKGQPRRSLYFEMGYSRAVLKDGWKYLALRYPEHAVSMPEEKRRKILEKFNSHQAERGRPIYTRDPLAPFSHISLIPGGGDAEAMSTGKRPGYYDADQLYNLADDPGEQRNLAGDPAHAEKLEELKTELALYLNGLPGQFAELGGRPAAPKGDQQGDVHTVNKENLHDYFYFSDEYQIHTNLWGAHAMKENVPEFTFNLRHCRSNPLAPPAYDWSISDELSAPIFPFFGYGDRMWKEQRRSTTTRLPIRIGELGTCNIHFDLQIDTRAFRKAKGNLAVDVWLGDQATGNDDSMRTEIMLWFDRNDQYPIGGKNHQGTYEFGGAKWDLFIGELSKDGTLVATFIAQQPVYEGTIDFTVPLNVVKEKGNIDDSTWLGGFELGNEIYKGKGATHIKQFYVDLRPKTYPLDDVVNQWLFNDQPTGKRPFNGAEGFDTDVENREATGSRTVMARFRVDDTHRRQVVYKEGGAESGLSIYVSAGKIHVANWNTVDRQVSRSIVGSPLAQQADSQSKRPAQYNVVVAVIEGKALTAYLNGKTVGSRAFHGLLADRGTTTLGYTDGPLLFHTGLSDKAAFLKGVIDDVVIFNKPLSAKEIEALK